MQKVAIITGTGGGIGNSLAKLLLDNRYIVFGYSKSNKIEHQNFHFSRINLSLLKKVKKIQFPKLHMDTHVLLVNNAATIERFTSRDKIEKIPSVIKTS